MASLLTRVNRMLQSMHDGSGSYHEGFDRRFPANWADELLRQIHPPNTFLHGYIAALKSGNTGTATESAGGEPYCFFDNKNFWRRRVFRIERLRHGMKWEFSVQGIWDPKRKVTRRQGGNVRGQLFINMFVVLNHWALHDVENETVMTDQSYVDNPSPPSLVDTSVRLGDGNKLLLTPGMFSLVSCLRDWARLAPLQYCEEFNYMWKGCADCRTRMAMDLVELDELFYSHEKNNYNTSPVSMHVGGYDEIEFGFANTRCETMVLDAMHMCFGDVATRCVNRSLKPYQTRPLQLLFIS
jgi:hypothetical protein